jgi:hypothetical protein
MPQLVRTPEEVLRATKRDLYLIRFHEGKFFAGCPVVTTRPEVEKWFAERLPHVELESLGPSEESGIVLGGCEWLMRVDFDEESLKLFVDAWENPDGSYRDKRWDCCVYPYSLFLQKSPFANRPPPDEESRW